MQNVERAAEQQPVLRFTLENGLSFRLGADQVVFKVGMVATRAGDLKVGDDLEPAFAFPAGYVSQDEDGNERVGRGGVKLTAIEPAGTADLYRLGVNQTGTFFLSAGVLCKADDSPV